VSQISPIEHATTRNAVAYNGAHYGKSLFWYTSEFLFGFYLAEVYGIAPETLGLLLFIFLIWDALTDPVLGVFLTRRRSSTRALIKYQLFGAIFSAATFSLMFSQPTIQGIPPWAYAAVAGLLFRTAYTIYDVPQNVLFHRLAGSDSQRLVFSSLRAALSSFASLCVSGVAFLILAKSTISTQAIGFTFAAIGFSAVAILTAILLQVFVRLVPSDSANPAPDAEQPQMTLSFANQFDTQLCLVLAAGFFLALGWPLFGKLIPFFAKYVLDDAASTGLFIAVVSIAGFVSQPLWMAIGTKMRRTTVLKLTTSAVFLAGTLFGAVSQQGLVIATLITGLFAATTSAVGMLSWTILADTLARPENDKKNDVLAFGAFSFSAKLALGVGGLMVGFLLDYAQYVPDSPLSNNGQNMIVWAMAALPVFCTLVSCALLLSADQISTRSSK
jgi:Na+/melibiose symporter-like transporter